MSGKTKPPVFYVNGQPFNPAPWEEHLLASDQDGDPVCICGHYAPSALIGHEAVNNVRDHVRSESGNADRTAAPQADPWGTFGQPGETAVVTRLRTAREKAWPELQPAFDVAIMQAKQAEYEAERASTIAMIGHEPAYSPLVTALAESVEAPRAFDPWSPRAHL